MHDQGGSESKIDAVASAKLDRSEALERFAQLEAKLDQAVVELQARIDRATGEMSAALERGLKEQTRWLFVAWSTLLIAIFVLSRG